MLATSGPSRSGPCEGWWCATVCDNGRLGCVEIGKGDSKLGCGRSGLRAVGGGISHLDVSISVSGRWPHPWAGHTHIAAHLGVGASRGGRSGSRAVGGGVGITRRSVSQAGPGQLWLASVVAEFFFSRRDQIWLSPTMSNHQWLDLAVPQLDLAQGQPSLAQRAEPSQQRPDLGVPPIRSCGVSRTFNKPS